MNVSETRGLYSGCNVTTPYRCGDDKCVAYEHECARLVCPLNSPYQCPNLECVQSPRLCQDTFAARPFKDLKVEYVINDNTTANVGLELDGYELTRVPGKLDTLMFNIRTSFQMFFPSKGSPYFDATQNQTKTTVGIIIEPLSKSYAESIQNKLNPLKASVSEQHFNIKNHSIPPHFTVRSSILNITTYGRADDNEYFGAPVTMTIMYNPISNEKGVLAPQKEAAVTAPYN